MSAISPDKVATELLRYSPNGGTVLQAWRSTLANINDLLKSNNYDPIDTSASYELLTAMKKFPEEMPHQLSLIEWAFHTSNISCVGRYIEQFLGNVWSPEMCQKVWTNSFERTRKVVVNVLNKERAAMDTTTLSHEVMTEYAHWNFVLMERTDTDPVLDASKGAEGWRIPQIEAETKIAAAVKVIDDVKAAAEFKASLQKQPVDGEWQKYYWDSTRGIFSTLKGSSASSQPITPSKLESGEQLIDTSSEAAEEPIVPVDKTNFYLGKPKEDRVLEKSRESRVDADSDESDWECIATPSSSSVYLDDEEYQDIHDPESNDLDRLRNKFKALQVSSTKAAKKPVVDRRPRKLTVSSPLETQPGTTDSLLDDDTIFIHGEDEIRDNGKFISEENEEDISSVDENLANADSALWDFDSDSEQMACEVDDFAFNRSAAQQMTVDEKANNLVKEWVRYWNSSDSKLERWQKLMSDLGQQGDFSSIVKCKMALRPLWINVAQFLSAQRKPEDVILFRSERDLAAYTKVFGGMISASAAKQTGDPSPLRYMMAKVKRHFK